MRGKVGRNLRSVPTCNGASSDSASPCALAQLADEALNWPLSAVGGALGGLLAVATASRSKRLSSCRVRPSIRCAWLSRLVVLAELNSPCDCNLFFVGLNESVKSELRVRHFGLGLNTTIWYRNLKKNNF